MSDILRYRLPGGEVNEKIGSFFRIDSLDNGYSGFLISGFEKDQLFGFNEEPGESSIHLRKDPPFVLTKKEYEDIAAMFLASFNRKGIDKAVLSRVKNVDFDPASSDRLFRELTIAYPNAFVYLVSSDLFGTWIGATPEKLMSVRDGKASTVSLAGTKPSEDESSWGEKESEEQRYVTDFIVERLVNAGLTDIVVSDRFEVTAGPVKHLKNDINFNIKGIDPLSVALELHPTPAVSGFPQKQAIDLILELEPHKRELYSGFIGLIDQSTSDLFVNLRCCSIGENAAYLYLGGGFTAASLIEKEWEETENKSKTLLNILQKL